MCGRFTLRNPQPIINQFKTEEFEPRFNISPSQKILTIADKPSFIKWGFTPYWAKEPFNLINARAACHPVRLLADCHEHIKLPQPLITPASMLPEDVQQALAQKKLLDFGIAINRDGFSFHEHYAELPTSLVIAYVLAIATCGQASSIFLAGFDGYGADDPRYKEMDNLINSYQQTSAAVDLLSITPTLYGINTQSLFGIIK